MKIILATTLLLLSMIGCRAQIVPIEDVKQYHNTEEGYLGEVTYIKDVNHHLDKFEGTWTGTYDGKNIEITISKITRVNIDGLLFDTIRMRHKITSAIDPNIVYEDTYALPEDDIRIVDGGYLDKPNLYVTHYTRPEPGVCGQDGEIFLGVVNNGQNMNLTLLRDHDSVNPGDCLTDPVFYFPVSPNDVKLYKQ